MTVGSEDERTIDERTWLNDIGFDIVTVRRYDTNDIVIGIQHFVLMYDDTMDDGYVVSSIAEPPEPTIDE